MARRSDAVFVAIVLVSGAALGFFIDAAPGAWIGVLGTVCALFVMGIGYRLGVSIGRRGGGVLDVLRAAVPLVVGLVALASVVTVAELVLRRGASLLDVWAGCGLLGLGWAVLFALPGVLGRSRSI
jgi:hypothetical protein